MVPAVRVCRHAFETMLFASAETFKKECFGFVFGCAPVKTRNEFIVTAAMPLQGIHRCNTKLHALARWQRRLEEFSSRMPRGSRPCGDFHSHTERAGVPYPLKISEEDTADMRRRQSELAFIIGISSRKKGSAEWRANDDGSATGSFGGGRYNYNFDVRAYWLPSGCDENEKPRQIKIIAPEAIRAFNRAMGYCK